MANQKKHSELQYKKAHDVLLTVLDSIDATIYVSSMENYEILYVNKHLKDQFGADLEGKICHECFQGSEIPCSQCTDKVLLNNLGEPTGVHVCERQNPLNKKWYRNYDRAIKWIDGSWVHLQISTDISNSKEVEKSLLFLHDELENQVQERTEKLFKANIELKVKVAEHNKVKKALIESERFLNKAQEISNTGHFKYDFKTKELSWSNQYYRILGLKPDHPPKPDHDFFISRVHPDDREEVNRLLVADNGFKAINLNFEYRTVPIKGSIHTIQVFSEVENDKSGQPLWMQGINQDITVQRDAQSKLTKSEALYRTLVDNISEGLIITDRDFKINFINPKFSEITGYENEEILNQSTEIFFDTKNRKKIKTFFLQNLKGISSSLEVEVTRKDAVKLPVTISGNPMMEEGVFNGTFIVVTNLSHIRQAERKVHESIRNLNRAQKISQTGSWSWDPGTNQNIWSDEMCRILGYPPLDPKNIVESTFYDKIHHRDREIVYQSLEGGWLNGVPFDYEYQTVPIDGEIKTIRCFAEIDLDENGNPSRLIGIDQDITEYRRSEKDLKAAKIEAEASNEAKTNFLANMSHELRTPMQGILGFSKLCLSRIKELHKDKIEEYLEDIYASAVRLMSLLNDLLDLSKLEAKKFRYNFIPEKINSLILEKIIYLRLLAEEKSLNILFEEEKLNSDVEMDAKKIGQVVDNLLSNAIRYSSPKSNITLQVIDQNDFIKFSINSFGTKIPTKELKSIFNKFSQSSNTRTGAGGIGLGLAICKQIISDHYGEIWAENNPDQSVTFNFQLPKLHQF
ncbi:MAG: PAS domain S-box protein [Deltaproteobacteria bacterium]|jgi:PAS domain S-box-containing protein|nr:PAS domain S-box protein [Deltaproteobacteria bacterium]MBT4527396.1 PAS domain S-box protein [Deltaproteobacteria bacterium]